MSLGSGKAWLAVWSDSAIDVLIYSYIISDDVSIDPPPPHSFVPCGLCRPANAGSLCGFVDKGFDVLYLSYREQYHSNF